MYDLRNAATAEEGKPFEFTVDGETFEFPPIAVSDWLITDKLQAGDLPGAIRTLLGDEAFARFTKLRISLAEINGLLNAYTASMGTSLGEFAASPSS
jgi:hypothetical protein